MKIRIALVVMISLIACSCVAQPRVSAMPALPVGAAKTGAGTMAAVATMAPTSVVTMALQDDPVAEKIHNSWPWYLTRASGLIAAILLVILLVSGVGLLTGGTFKFLEPLVAWAAHRAMGIAFGVAVLVHVFSLLFDKFVGFNFADLLIPFVSNYKPATIAGHYLGSLYMAFGTIAFYCVIAIIVTSLTLINAKPRPWKLVHFLSYVILALTFVHGLFMGTDLNGGAFRLLWIIGGVLLIIPLVQRLRRAFTLGSRSGK